jgi:hypothetical protein
MATRFVTMVTSSLHSNSGFVCVLFADFVIVLFSNLCLHFVQFHINPLFISVGAGL